MKVNTYGSSRISDRLVRGSLAFLLIINSYDNIANFSELLSWLSLYNITGILLAVIILIQLTGAVALMLDWKVLYTALALAFVTAMSALLFDSDFNWVLASGFVIYSIQKISGPYRDFLSSAGMVKQVDSADTVSREKYL